MAESERTRTCLQNRLKCERIRLQTRVSGSVTDLVTVFFFKFTLGQDITTTATITAAAEPAITTGVHLVVLWSVALFIARS